MLKDRQAIDDHKKKKLPGLIPLVGVNISISHKGFAKVSPKNKANGISLKNLSLILVGDR